MLSAFDPVDWEPQRIAVAGTSGSGKTTLSGQVAEILGYPRVEIDSLYHGPGWQPRDAFLADVEAFIAGPRWVIELQYRQARPLITARADTVLWLDYPTVVQMRRLIRRTLHRRLWRKRLWNGNVEPSLATIFTDDEHILRWGWRTRNQLKPVIPTLEARFPGLRVVHLRNPRETRHWVESLSGRGGGGRGGGHAQPGPGGVGGTRGGVGGRFVFGRRPNARGGAAPRAFRGST
ncbi:AAA family ATPase [Corynebacterium pacaense]|uniref:AAA family ATPase n=1 Tax=Corynebacterium pacaense TaxID=1816684 RepID=UPI001FE93EC1|nr:AAA family ATPase [Corynebacterium pacaense]